MTQFARPSLVAATDDGITLSTKSNGAWEALYTNHAGAAAPPAPEKGQVWVDTSQEAAGTPTHTTKVYTGSVWRTLGTLNLTTGAYTVAGNLPAAGGPVTGPILFPGGSAAAPSITFDADTNMGIFRVGADRLGFSTNGVNNLEINAAGQIGMGNVAVDPFRLYVAQKAADAVVASRTIRAINLNTASDASANIEFATASGALRGAVRGQREGATNHGSLVLSSALSGGSVDVLQLLSNGNALFNGHLNAQDITAVRTAAPTNGAIYLGNTGTRYLFYDGTNYTLGGPAGLVLSGNVTLNGSNPSISIGPAQIWSGSNHFFINPRSDYRQYWESSNGHWYWQHATGANTDMQLVPGGELRVANVYNSVAGNGAMLRTEDNAHGVNFFYQWTGFYSQIGFRIDRGGSTGVICTQTNANLLGLAGGTGGPTGVSLNLFDNGGQLFGIYADAVSDERIKDNIRNTEVDALGVIGAVPVRAFDVKGEVAAWSRSVGKTTEQRQEMLASATPAPVPIGFVAQEVGLHIPEAVGIQSVPQPEGSPLPENMQTLIQQNMVPYLWRAIQQQQEIINTLTARVAALEGAQ
jgi:hypothetical protein